MSTNRPPSPRLFAEYDDQTIARVGAFPITFLGLAFILTSSFMTCSASNDVSIDDILIMQGLLRMGIFCLLFSLLILYRNFPTSRKNVLFYITLTYPNFDRECYVGFAYLALLITGMIQSVLPYRKNETLEALQTGFVLDLLGLMLVVISFLFFEVAYMLDHPDYFDAEHPHAE